MNNAYCNSLTNYSRFKTRVIKIGDLSMGGDFPIRIQSMTTTDTMDTKATVAQSIRMIEAGCELVRITAPSVNEAKNLENIKNELRAAGYSAPLIADIHFTPNAAELAARIVEKVRVNPGNYADKKKFETIDYTDLAYEAELERIRERFIPLVKICKEYGTAMRIGTNHGSLSDRILSRYGDTPLGMVESAMEFLRICEDEGYHNLVLSMKASNPQVMVQAYRLLVNHMMAAGMNYPLHLGVTEAGEGEDGRIKSAVGIGTLLEDGLGDTVRVSLTEDPEFEAPVAIALVDRYSKRKGHAAIPEINENPINPFEFAKRESIKVTTIGEHQVGRVIIDLSAKKISAATELKGIGYNYSEKLDKWGLNDRSCDFIYLGSNPVDFEMPGTLRLVYDYSTWNSIDQKHHSYPYLKLAEFLSLDTKPDTACIFAATTLEELSTEVITQLSKFPQLVLVLHTTNEHAMPELRRAFFALQQAECKVPVIIAREYPNLDEEKFQLYASTDCGALLLDGFGDGIWLKAPHVDTLAINNTVFGILQATRNRISKTEYISCPSCGRTLFDLQETTARIRNRTDHLKGVKIGIMGCIVNGPGEMADADYGYVGTGVGKITLYRSKEVVKRNVNSEQAVDELINLIKEDGRWLEKDQVVEHLI